MTARELINKLLDSGCSMNTEVLINLNEPHKTKDGYGWSAGFHFDIEKVTTTGSIIELTFKDWRVTADDE